jgi:hypothetical protein
MKAALGCLLLALYLVLPGCKKDDASTSFADEVNLTEDDAADAFAGVLAGNQGTCGLSGQIEEAAIVAGGGGLPKVSDNAGLLFDTTVTRVRTGTYSYAYSFRYSYSFAGANQFNFSFSMKGVFETPRLSSSDSAGATLQLSSLLTGSSYLVSGIYNRYGALTSKVRNKVGFRSTITISTTGLSVDKTSKKIVGGAATLTLSGQTNGGKIFAFTATVAFSGGQQAILAIGGKTYTVNLTLGDAS